MRIVQVAPFYTPVIGGVEDVVKHIAEHMAGRGHEVYVVTYNRLRTGGAGGLPKEEEINGVHVVRLKPTATWSHGSYSPELPNVVRSLKPDVVHVHVWRHPHVFQIAKLRREMRFKAILHGHAPFHKLNQLGLVTWTYHRLADTLLRGALRSYDTYIALTIHEKEISTRKLGLSEDKIAVIPNGIEEDRCKPKNDRDNTVLYLGRISKAKNIQLLVRAMAIVKDKVRDAMLVMAGPEEEPIGELSDYTNKHGVKMRYLGTVDEEQKHELYLRSKVYALPSTYEPFGITLLEAGIHATPSAITGNGGQSHAAPPGKASLWAEPKPEKYAEAITQLLTDDQLWKKLSNGAYEHAQNFTWRKILPLYERLYAE